MNTPTQTAMQWMREYLKGRKPQFQQFHTGSRVFQASAQSVLRAAKIRAEWREHEADEHNPQLGEVRLNVVPDDSADFADLCGDTFDPDVNTDIPASRLEREEKEFRERVNRDGVWGVVGEYYDGREWQHADSCFGFVGEDWKGSGYDVDIMQATLKAAAENLHCACADRGCPVHAGQKSCGNKASIILYRVDMQDETGTLFCDDCATDALNSGLFNAYDVE